MGIEIAPEHLLRMLDMPDEDLGLEVLNIWLMASSEESDETPEAILESVLTGQSSLRFSDPANLGLMHTVIEAAAGRLDQAGKLFRDWVRQDLVYKATTDEAQTGRRRNRRNAGKQRPDALTHLLLPMVKENPKLSYRDAIHQLEAEHDVDHEAGKIYLDDRDSGYKLRTIPARLTRLRKKVQKNSN